MVRNIYVVYILCLLFLLPANIQANQASGSENWIESNFITKNGQIKIETPEPTKFETSSEQGNMVTVSLKTYITVSGKKVEVIIDFFILPDPDKDVLTPSYMALDQEGRIEIIDTGRYMTFIEWQKQIHGVNWQGQMIYIHKVRGDGQTSKVNNFRIWATNPKNISIDFSLYYSEDLSTKDLQIIFKIIKSIELTFTKA